jgi:hypothetical protein
VERTTAKKIPATRESVDRSATGRVISPAVSLAVQNGNAPKRWNFEGKPGRMAARVEWGHEPVNQKILLKISQKSPGFPALVSSWTPAN